MKCEKTTRKERNSNPACPIAHFLWKILHTCNSVTIACIHNTNTHTHTLIQPHAFTIQLKCLQKSQNSNKWKAMWISRTYTNSHWSHGGSYSLSSFILLALMKNTDEFKCVQMYCDCDLSYAKFGNTTLLLAILSLLNLSNFVCRIFYTKNKDCLIHLISLHSEHVSVFIRNRHCKICGSQRTRVTIFSLVIITVNVFVVTLCATQDFSLDNPCAIGKYTI